MFAFRNCTYCSSGHCCCKGSGFTETSLIRLAWTLSKQSLLLKDPQLKRHVGQTEIQLPAVGTALLSVVQWIGARVLPHTLPFS